MKMKNLRKRPRTKPKHFKKPTRMKVKNSKKSKIKASIEAEEIPVIKGSVCILFIYIF
jgi:hypothetical protein